MTTPYISGQHATMALAIIGTPVTTGTADTPYAGFTVRSQGGAGPHTYSLVSGALPAGLTLNATTGAVAGTPTVAGLSAGLVIRSTDRLGRTADLASFDITVAAA
jgi:hypothetical protein